jgi:hypothetical protein
MVAERGGASNAYQLYSARLSCHLMGFGVTVWAAGYAHAVMQTRKCRFSYPQRTLSRSQFSAAPFSEHPGMGSNLRARIATQQTIIRTSSVGRDFLGIPSIIGLGNSVRRKRFGNRLFLYAAAKQRHPVGLT